MLLLKEPLMPPPGGQMGALYATVQNSWERTVHVPVAGIHMTNMLRRLLEREFTRHLILQCCANMMGEVVMRLVALVLAVTKSNG
jgi:hypothetical protein